MVKLNRSKFGNWPSGPASRLQHPSLFAPGFAGGGGGDVAYQIANSWRARASNSAYWTRTPGVAGNRQIFTFSCWVKGSPGTWRTLYSANNAGNSDYFCIRGSGAVDQIQFTGSDGVVCDVTATAVFRDPTAWQHVLLSVNTTHAIASERVRMYVNRRRLTSFSTANYPAQNTSFAFHNTVAQYIGKVANQALYGDFNLADVHVISGQALDPDSFVKYDPKTRQISPIKFTGTFGASDSLLSFGDATSTTTFGYDTSTKGNHWTASGISVSAGSTFDQSTDTPTNSFATINPLNNSGTSITNANRSWGHGASAYYGATLTQPITFPTYIEVKLDQTIGSGMNIYPGVKASSAPTVAGSYLGQGSASEYAFGVSNSTVYCGSNGVQTTHGSASSGTILQYAIDPVNGRIWFGVNNTWIDSGNPSTGANPKFTGLASELWFYVQAYATGAGCATVNAGQAPFAYTPPSGFAALNTRNLPRSPIQSPHLWNDAFTFTGNGQSQWIGRVPKRTAVAQNVARSLRFRRDVPSRGTFTPSGTMATRTKAFISIWFDTDWRASGGVHTLLGAHAGGPSDQITISWNDSGTTPNLSIIFGGYEVLRTQFHLRHTGQYRHIFVLHDTTQATANNRHRVWLDGVEITSWALQAPLAQNTATGGLFAAGGTTQIGAMSGTNHFGGFMAEVAVGVSSTNGVADFGETNPDGIWVPKAPSNVTWGAAGQGGFYYDFSDNSSTSNLWTDRSGLGNHATPTGFSVANDATNDSVFHVPSDHTGGGHMNILDRNSQTGGTVDRCGMRFVGGNSWQRMSGTLAMRSGKFYMEGRVESNRFSPTGPNTAYNAFGLCVEGKYNDTVSPSAGSVFDAIVYAENGWANNGGVWADQSGARDWYSGDVVSAHFDLDNWTYEFRRNNAVVGSGTINLPRGSWLTPCVISYSGSYGQISMNYGQQPWVYTPTTGFGAVGTHRITYLDTDLPFNGNPADLYIVKNRGDTTGWGWYDTVRGLRQVINSNNNAAEGTEWHGIQEVNKFGFRVGSWDGINRAGYGIVVYGLRRGATAGFDIVGYNGNGTAGRSVSHSLGVPPRVNIVKPRGGTVSNGWRVFHQALGSANYLQLNATASVAAYSDWNSQDPTSSVFYVNGAPAQTTNENGTAYISYLFADVAGYCKGFSFNGNGSADGVFVWLGFTPRIILYKNASDGTTSWSIWDAARSPFNVADARLELNSGNAESTLAQFDIVSGGFKGRANNGNNTSGHNIIGIALAAMPFEISLAR